MAARRDEEHELDDITLLNVHRYPDSVPASIVASVRNSKAAQKRLEELLKGMAGGRRSRVEVPVPEGQQQAAPEAPSSLRDLIKKFIP